MHLIASASASFVTLLVISFIVLSLPVLISGSANDAADRVWPTKDGSPPKLYGHCGERFLMPEHTVASYEIAAIEGADYVEPDLVLTKDGILVCYHDLAMKRATNVADHPEFADRRGNHSVYKDGKPDVVVDDWLIIHFTLDELKTLKVKQQPDGVRPLYFNELFSIATFQEFIDAVHKVSAKENGRAIGIIPELKHPFFHNFVFNSSENFMEEEYLNVLRSNGFPLTQSDEGKCKGVVDSQGSTKDIPCGPLIFQGFDKPSQQYLAQQITLPEIMMNVHPDVYLLTPKGIQEIANFSDYLCIWKEFMYTGVEAEISYRGWQVDADLVSQMGGFLLPHQFVPFGHSLGLKMSLFTIPDSREHSQRGCAVECMDGLDRKNEMFYYFDMGIDSMFVENVPEAMRIRLEYESLLKNNL
ncbi:unnamed protein product [Orchesella dallaii]|uniref:glycerophosphodiester phosphodiesterase n=1 Tax=Orchesella dallaii TaxID=48710 RepID=A0ABP1PZB9_9HEXA